MLGDRSDFGNVSRDNLPPFPGDRAGSLDGLITEAQLVKVGWTAAELRGQPPPHGPADAPYWPVEDLISYLTEGGRA